MSGPWRLRGYAVERLLGHGGSGDVWRARVASSGDPVALKRVLICDAEQAARAQAEAALLTALDHPHLVRLHAAVPTGEALVLVLDLADGGSLAELLAARGRLTPGEVITAIAPIAAGLAYLHDEGVVHGDVSAANVLFTPAGLPLLADVGVARLTGDDSDVASTPAYVDPAVAAGCVPGPQSDVFMLAGVALHALTGAPPWSAATGEAALELAARGVLDDVDERLAGVGAPDEMRAVLGRALAVDPHRRGTAADLALDLRHSAEPVAVELFAGRERPVPPALVPAGPRHAARPNPDRTAARDDRSTGVALSASPSVPPRDLSRPPFERPSTSGAVGAVGAAPPTRMVGPRPRPVIPRPRRRGARRRTVLIALGIALGALLAAAGTVWAATRNGTDAPSSHRHSAARPAARPAARSSAGRPTAPRSAASPPWPDARRALGALDATRARAFQTRDFDLLAQVYVRGPLLDADTARLRRIVPAGCGLAGVHTRYDDVRAAAQRGRLVITATARLPASTLVCHGRLRGTAAGTGPSRLHVEVVRTAHGLRIATQRVT